MKRTPKGRPMAKGRCPSCATNVTRFITEKEAMPSPTIKNTDWWQYQLRVVRELGNPVREQRVMAMTEFLAQHVGDHGDDELHYGAVERSSKGDNG